MLKSQGENKIIINLPPSPIESESEDNEVPPKLLIKIKSSNEIAHLNAINHASSLNNLDINSNEDTNDNGRVCGSYKTPSMLPEDQHSDLDSTSPKLKFGNVKVYEFIPKSPVASLPSDSPVSINNNSPNTN